MNQCKMFKADDLDKFHVVLLWLDPTYYLKEIIG